MTFLHIPKRFLVEVVKRVAVLVNSIPMKGGVHVALLPREIITGMKLQVPKYKIGQYMKGHVETINNTGGEHSDDSLYLGRANNGSGHIVFQIQTRQPISVS